MRHPELEPVAVDGATYPTLKDRPVLITGGGSGIGAHLVEAFAGQGSRVGFIERDEAAARASAAAAAAATGRRPEFEVADLRDVDATRRAAAALAARCGPFRALVNNAGNDDRLPVEEVTPTYWDDRFAVNLRHHFFVAQAVLGPMAEAGGGAIVNMGSNAWMQGAPGLICYTTAKSAVQGLTKSLARELGPRRIRVNAVLPGWILTERQVSRAKAIYPDKFADYLTRQCLKEFLLPPDVARMVLWLAADDARLVTGQSFIVDGGVV